MTIFNTSLTKRLFLAGAATAVLLLHGTPAFAKPPRPVEPAKKGCSLGSDSYDHGARQRVQITNADGTTQWISIKCNDGNWEMASRRVPARLLSRITAVTASLRP
jgi:hypothetical protein